MKRLLKKSLAFILALTLVVSAAPLAGLVGLELPKLSDLFASKAEAATYWDLNYNIIDGEVMIAYCDESASGDLAIPSSIEGHPVTSIGYAAFNGCAGLTSIKIPDSVTSIGDGAFSNCTGLTRITIPDSIISIGDNAFYNTGIYNDSSNWENDVLYIEKYLIEAKSTISENYSIKTGTKTIADYAFHDCAKLTSIAIPGTVTSIGGYAFYSCTGLTSVIISNNITNLSDGTFAFCKSLTSITIPDGVTSIGEKAFIWCTGLTSITIPDSVTSVDSQAFWHCTGLTSVTIPDSVTSIGYRAFYECTSLTDVYYIGTEEEWNKISIDYGNSYLLNATIHFNSEPIPKSSVTSIVIADELPITSGNTLTFEVTTSTDITKLRIEDCGYVVNEWTGTEYYTDNDGVRTWTVTQIINTIGENRYLDFRAGNTEGYEENTYQSPVFTCIENEQKLPATTIEHPLSSGAFLQGDEQNLIWTVDGVPGDGTVPDYFIINVFKDNKLVFAERNLTAVDYLGNDGKFFYNLDGGYFEETGEYKISVTSVKEGYQYSDDEVVVSIYPPDLYIEGFNSEIEMVNVGENYYFSGKIKGANENISVVIQTPSESSNHEYFSQTKVVQEFDLSTLYPITFGSGKYSEPGEYYIKIFARSLGKGEDTLLAQKRIVLLEDGVQQLDKPVITSGVVTKIGESYKITWDAVDNADYYTVIVSELGIRQTGIETESFELSDKTFKSAGEYTILVYAHSYSDEYVTSNNSIKLTVTKQDVGCSVLSARIIGDTTIKAGYFLNFEVVTTQDATKLRLMDKNYVVTEWTDSSSYVDKDGKRYWTIKEMMKTVGVNRKLQFAAGNSQGYSDVKAEVTFTCNENPNKLGNIKITSPVDGCSYDQNNLQYLVWNYDSEILPDYYIVEVFTNSQTKKYLNKNVAGNLLWIEIPAEYFENTGTYTISITAVKEFYQPSSANVTFLSKCTHLHTEMSDPVMIKGSYKILNDTQHSYQTQAVETCINCGVQVNKIVETKTENHNMHEGLLCACGQYKTQSGFKVIDGLYLQSNKSEYTYLDASTTLGYWGSVSPSDSGYISMLGKVTRNGKEYAFIRYPLNGGGYKCGFIRSELIGNKPLEEDLVLVNGSEVGVIYDDEGSIYANSKDLFKAMGGSSFGIFQSGDELNYMASIKLLHQNFKTYFLAYVTDGVDNNKYQLRYYEDNYFKETITDENKMLWCIFGEAYFPISLIIDFCGYKKVSQNEYVYCGLDSNAFEIISNNYINDYSDVLFVNEESLYGVNSKNTSVNIDMGVNVIGELQNIPYNVSYKNGFIRIVPTSSGIGKINIYYIQNDIKTLIFSKTVHCKIKENVNNIVFMADRTDKNYYILAESVVATNIRVDSRTNGYNVYFDVYNGRASNTLIRAFDKNGKACGSYSVCRGNDVETGLINLYKMYNNYKIMGLSLLLNGEDQSSDLLLNKSELFCCTNVSLWVPKGGYISVFDASNNRKALDYDISTLYSQNYDAVDDILFNMAGDIEFFDDITFAAFEKSLNSFNDEYALLDFIENETLDAVLDYIALKVPIVGAANMITAQAGNLITKKRISSEIKKNVGLYCQNNNKIFGCSNIYIKGNATYSLAPRNSSISNESDNKIIPETTIQNGYYVASVNKKYGLCNINGDFVISPEWRYVNDYGCGIVPVVDDDGCKFLDITGKVLFETNHIFTESFLNNRCLVVGDNYKIGIIDTQGKQIVPCSLDYAWILHDGYVLAMKDDSYSIIDSEGKTLFTFTEEFVGLSSDRKVIATKDKNGLIGAVGYTGEIIAKNKFDDTGGANGNAVAMEKDGIYTVFDLNGKKLFEIAADYVGEFSDGVVTVKDDNGVRLINLSGDTVADMPDDVSDVCPFKDKHAVVYYSDGSYAYMNNQYQIVSDKYSFASDFKDGYAVVSVTENGSETWMLIDESFNAVNVFAGDLEFRQDDFNNGYVFMSIEDGETGYITVGDMKEQNEQLSFEKSQTCLREEGTEKLNVFSRNGDPSLVWESSNPSVATVDSSGNVVALSVGETIVTVSSDKGNTSECVVKVLPNKYKLTWIVDGDKTEQVIKIGNTIDVPVTPTKPGYKFAGWSPEVPEMMPSEDITFFAVFECISDISIKNNPGTKTIKYGETLKLTAITTNMPTGANIYWFVDGVKKGEGETFEVSPKNGSIEITVKIVDVNGNVLIDKNGNEIQDSEKVSVNSGLWQKIVSFFKNLFRMNRTVVQAIFKGTI